MAPPGRFRADIEGLRAVAVVVVVAYHARVPGFTGGFVGVDVFFVISGFLITGLLLRDTEASAWERIRHFYARRVRRIVPAATLVIVLTLAGAAALQNPLLQPAARTDAISAMFFLSNIRFHYLATDYFNQGAAPSLFQHYWSLSIEEQFYIVWPAMVVALSAAVAARRRTALLGVVTVIGLASFLFGWRTTSSDPSFAFFMLPARGWELCCGAALALVADRVRLSLRASSIVRAAGVGLIVAGVTGLDDGTAFPGVAALLPVLGSALVIAAGLPSAAHEGNVLTPRLMQLGGRYSYSLYLWHWPALLLVGLRRPTVHTQWREAVVVMAAIALPGAVASFHLVEHPFRAWFSHRPDRHSLLAGVGVAAFFGFALLPYGAAAAVTLDAGRAVAMESVVPAHATDFVPSNVEPTLTDARQVRDVLEAIRCERTKLGCVTGDRSATVTVVLYGDSYANHWALTFALLGREHHWRIEILGRAGCRSFEEHQPSLGKDCPRFRAEAQQRIRELRPALVVFSNQSMALFAKDRAAWAKSIEDAVAGVPADVPAVVLSQTPRAERDIPECLAAHLDATRSCEPRREPFDAMNDAMRAVVEGRGRVYADIRAWFCSAKRCPVVMSNVLVYRDRGHLTGAFTRTRTDAMYEILRKFVAR